MSRDAKRINRIIEILRAKWLSYPDLRLTQLILNAVDAEDPFYIEDEEIEKALKKFPH